jgi:polyhydroxyalkanoate synthesis repressor PhaR
VETTEPQTKKTSGQRVIKRYANRKLYDTRDSRYVTLVQIAEYVRNGEEVQIIDNTSKEDLTHVTLAQIIYEEEKKGEGDSRQGSIGTLRQFIQTGSQRLVDTFRESPISKVFQRREDGVELKSEAKSEPPADEHKRNALLDKSREALEELQRIADDRLRLLVTSAIAPVHHLQSEVKRLQARIDELERSLVKAAQPKGKGRKGSEEQDNS